MTEPDFRPPPANQRSTVWLALLVILLAVGAYVAWQYKDQFQRSAPAEAPPPAQASATDSASTPIPLLAMPAPTAEASSTPQDEAPSALQALTAQPLHPGPETADDSLSADDAAGADEVIRAWLQERGAKWVVFSQMPHHVAATIDQLPRSHAAPRLWPLLPVGGKMVVQETPEGLLLSPENSQRYDALVAFITSIDPAQAMGVYRRLYPVFQAAYEHLGYPGKHFNDRLVQVIDHLLQTPDVKEPIGLYLVQVQGDMTPERPWLRYEYADPQLQSLSAGQKILIRLGAQHRATLKQYLQQVRAQVASR